MSHKGFFDFVMPMMNPKSAQPGKTNLSFAGNGKVSVPVSAILSSERVKEQVEAVRELAKAINVIQPSEAAGSANAKHTK